MNASICDQGLMNVRQAASFLDCSEFRIRELVRRGTLPSVSLDGPRGLRVPRLALVQFAARHLNDDNQEAEE